MEKIDLVGQCQKSQIPKSLLHLNGTIFVELIFLKQQLYFKSFFKYDKMYPIKGRHVCYRTGLLNKRLSWEDGEANILQSRHLRYGIRVFPTGGRGWTMSLCKH